MYLGVEVEYFSGMFLPSHSEFVLSEEPRRREGESEPLAVICMWFWWRGVATDFRSQEFRDISGT